VKLSRIFWQQLQVRVKSWVRIEVNLENPYFLPKNIVVNISHAELSKIQSSAIKLKLSN
jgi:hypothetical protein